MNPKRFSIDSVDRFRSSRTHAPTPGHRVLRSDPGAPKTKTNLKRLSIATAIRRKSNRIHALASRLRAIRPDLVTLLKLSLLSIAALAATEDAPTRPFVIEPCKIKISCETQEWSKYIADETDDAWKMFRKGFKGTKNQKTFDQLRYVDGRFFHNDKLIPFIETPLTSIECGGTSDRKAKNWDKNTIVIKDNQKIEYTLKFEESARRDAWLQALDESKKKVLFYNAFWQKVLNKVTGNKLFSIDDIKNLTSHKCKENIRTTSRCERLIFAKQFQTVMRPTGGCSQHAWDAVGEYFKGLDKELKGIVRNNILKFLDQTAKDHYAECLMAFLADIENLNNQFFQHGVTKKKVLMKHAIWREARIWHNIFLALLKKNMLADFKGMTIEQCLQSILISANTMFLPQAHDFIVGDDVENKVKQSLFEKVKKNAMDHIWKLIRSKVPEASREEFDDPEYQSSHIEPLFNASAEAFSTFIENDRQTKAKLAKDRRVERMRKLWREKQKGKPKSGRGGANATTPASAPPSLSAIPENEKCQ